MNVHSCAIELGWRRRQSRGFVVAAALCCRCRCCRSMLLLRTNANAVCLSRTRTETRPKLMLPIRIEAPSSKFTSAIELWYQFQLGPSQWLRPNGQEAEAARVARVVLTLGADVDARWSRVRLLRPPAADRLRTATLQRKSSPARPSQLPCGSFRPQHGKNLTCSQLVGPSRPKSCSEASTLRPAVGGATRWPPLGVSPTASEWLAESAPRRWPLSLARIGQFAAPNRPFGVPMSA